MFHHILAAVKSELSGIRALRQVEAICAFHRIQASPGFREAAHYCHGELKAAGLDAEILSYPANTSTRYWSQPMFQEWHCTGAELELLEPERRRLAGYHEHKMSLIQRSAATPPGGVEAELVAVEKSDRPESYSGVEVKGKFVLADGDLTRTRSLAVEQHGALGLVTDRMSEFPPVRHRMDIPDALQYTSFWWDAGATPCPGFVLSPKTGESLRKLLKSAQGPLKVRARVDASLYDGSMEVVSAVIAGQGPGEVVVVAHLCHPQPSANDNASGAAAVLEIARALRRLIDEGTLPPPQRTIRFLLLPEMTGTYAFLAGNEGLIPHMVAAINLDMVGEKQELCGGPLMLERPPRSTPSFTGDLLERILEALAGDVKNLAGTASYALFKWGVMPFSGGSDHYIFSDPTVDVPCPMVIQWPDRYYHTNADTVDKVDPFMMGKVSCLAATYAYFLAVAGYAEAVWMAQEQTFSFARELHQAARARFDPVLTAAGEPEAETGRLAAEATREFARLSAFLKDRRIQDIHSLSRLLAPAEQKAFAAVVEGLVPELDRTTQAEAGRWQAALAFLKPAGRLPEDPEEAEWRKVAVTMVPRRSYRGPVSLHRHLFRLDTQEREEWAKFMEGRARAASEFTHALYWMDGRRSLAEVHELVQLETGSCDGEALVKLTRLLAKLGLI
ncbi:MAG TPA: hypothetical protein DCM14_06015, partial [Clostridiales bacterium UBA8153]|nr:hypothetical protein [Clostridiales bacterium UBA8153]